MIDQPSGIYIINKDYDVVSYNRIVGELYPQLKVGEKCYKCLMGLDEPCPICPVKRKVQGPQTYFDPIRKIYEMVDAVPLGMKEDEQYALVFSTTGERERYARYLPNNESEFVSLYEQEYYDKLTGGFSLKGIIREIERILANSTEEDEFVILYFNIRNFKAINDVFGLEAGDMLLCQCYYAIKNSPHQTLAIGRNSGDQFIALVKKSEIDLDYIRNNASTPWTYNGKTVQIHSVCGLYEILDKTIPVSSMIDRARLAIDSIEVEHMRPYVIFDEKMRRDYVNRARVLANYESAIKDKRFQVYYQPVVDTYTGKVVSAEALVRWISLEGVVVTPDIFIPVLEERGHIASLDLYVMQSVYETYCTRRDASKSFVPVSVNFSWMDLYDHSLIDFLKNLLKSKEIPDGFIRIETTETALNSMEQISGEFLAFLRKNGAKILLDDFGSGYSSFGMIQKYDFDILKIDREFIRNIERSSKTQNILRAIIAMCHEMNVKVVAEGVETKDEYEFLKANECDYIQGYYFAKPMPEEEFFQFLDSHS